jgi:hypothetical protein
MLVGFCSANTVENKQTDDKAKSKVEKNKKNVNLIFINRSKIEYSQTVINFFVRSAEMAFSW